MILIQVPSQSCPHCRKPEGNCSMVVNEVGTLRAFSVKQNEFDLRAQFEGRNGPAYREAYIVQKYVCLNGTGVK